MSIPNRFRPWAYIGLIRLIILLFLFLNTCDGNGGEGRKHKPAKGMPVTIVGTVQFEDQDYDASGFKGKTLKPVRSAMVEVVQNTDGAVLASGETNQNGSYDLTFTNNGAAGVYISVLARDMDNTVEVRDTGGALYAISSPVIEDTSADHFNIDLTASLTAAGGVFNILDIFLEAAEFIEDLAGTKPPLVTALWETGSCSGTFFTPLLNTISILGGCNGDTDEYDDTVLLHEYGHFIAAHYSRDDSPSGDHFLDDHTQDIRLSWSEGWGSFFFAAVLGDPLYVDTIGTVANIAFDIEELSSPMMELSTLSTLAVYTTNELSVAAVLWDILDASPDEVLAGGGDTVSAGMDPIWDVITNYLTCTTCGINNVSFEDFWDGWFTQGYDLMTEMEIVAADRKMALEADPFEPDDILPGGAGITVNGAVQFHTLFPAEDRDLASFSASSGVPYTIETRGLTNGADTYLEILDADGIVLDSNDNADQKNYSNNCCPPNDALTLSSKGVFTPSTAGNYSIRVRQSPDAPPSAGLYGGYELRVTSP
jgi:hypothetical protein